MISIVNKRFLRGKTPKQLFDFFVELNNTTFKAFHPIEHLFYKRTKGVRGVIGSEYIFEHVIEGKLLKHAWRVYSAKEYSHIFSKAKGLLPIQLKLTFKKVPGGTEVLHEIHAGFEKLGKFGKLIDYLAQKTIFPKSQIAALKVHSQEELAYLEKVV